MFHFTRSCRILNASGDACLFAATEHLSVRFFRPKTRIIVDHECTRRPVAVDFLCGTGSLPRHRAVKGLYGGSTAIWSYIRAASGRVSKFSAPLLQSDGQPQSTAHRIPAVRPALGAISFCERVRDGWGPVGGYHRRRHTLKANIGPGTETSTSSGPDGTRSPGCRPGLRPLPRPRNVESD